jgi:hypothetical protein
VSLCQNLVFKPKSYEFSIADFHFLLENLKSTVAILVHLATERAVIYVDIRVVH